MKKIILSLGLIIGLAITQINAQSISGGIKADANLSNFILSDMGNAESSMNIGASLGGFLKIDLSESFALQPELLFHFKSSEMKQSGIKNDYEYWGAEIPVYALYQINIKESGRFFVGFGPYIGVGFSAKYTTGDIDLYKKYNDKAAMQRIDFGAGAMFGYEFNCGLIINAGYKIGFIDSLDMGKKDATMLPSTISLGIGYKF